ncbi:hypothetical protein AAW14_30165 [Streptomyces hygroscopicus]|uniref:hypothetical protein n=1 Tax=Streptomyces hygroscopicus TaxID=1912 RepID=UPI00223EEBC7|nr:hypothetical protein [Streptomyces hygroscopicus]MCW7946148.1 hypothetical protein [Streptomyces hygroscopicus]
MGERLSGDGVRGRRRAHPDGALSGPWDALDDAGLEMLLATALRGGHSDADAEQRAVAAFRVARDSGAHRARTRRRDDWRVREERRVGRPVKTTLGVLFASLTLGGVAVAAIGSAGSSSDNGDGRGDAHPSTVAPHRPRGESSQSSAGSGRPDHPATAQDAEAHCRAYEQVKSRGKALDSTAWHWLVSAAHGEDKVVAYCSEQLARATERSTPSHSAATDGTGNSDKDAAKTGEKSAKSDGSSQGSDGRGSTSGGQGGAGKGSGGKGK